MPQRADTVLRAKGKSWDNGSKNVPIVECLQPRGVVITQGIGLVSIVLRRGNIGAHAIAFTTLPAAESAVHTHRCMARIAGATPHGWGARSAIHYSYRKFPVDN